MIDRKVATTRNTRSQGETWDGGRRFMLTLEEDLTHAGYGSTRRGQLTIEWTGEDGTPGGQLTLGHYGIAALREILELER